MSESDSADQKRVASFFLGKIGYAASGEGPTFFSEQGSAYTKYGPVSISHTMGTYYF